MAGGRREISIRAAEGHQRVGVTRIVRMAEIVRR
jgi:hypothetical protein